MSLMSFVEKTTTFESINYQNLAKSQVKFTMSFKMFFIIRVPTRTGKPGKPGKMGRHFPVREKSGNFEKTGKVREKSGKIKLNTGKLQEFEINII